MLVSVVECVGGAWLHVCGRAWVPVGADTELFHVKQFEDDGRFESRYGQVLSGLEPGLRRLLGVVCGVCLCCPPGEWMRC